MQDRQAFLQEFRNWGDEDIDGFAQEADFESVSKLLSVLTEGVHGNASRLLRQKEQISQVEQDICTVQTNLSKLQQIGQKHRQKRLQQEQQKKKLDHKLRQFKEIWKRLQLSQ